MNKITVEPPHAHQLGEKVGEAVLCDVDGRVLGFFSPLPDHPHVDELQLASLLSIAETEELRKFKTGKTLQEILARYSR
jgi:hypothetical protein